MKAYSQDRNQDGNRERVSRSLWLWREAIVFSGERVRDLNEGFSESRSFKALKGEEVDVAFCLIIFQSCFLLFLTAELLRIL